MSANLQVFAIFESSVEGVSKEVSGSSIDQSIGFLLSATGRKVSQALTVTLQPYGVTSEQFAVLAVLLESVSDSAGITQKELSLRSQKDPTNVTRILNQLQRKGLIRRQENAEDRRSFVIHLTDKGKQLAAALVPIEEYVVRSVCNGLTDQEIIQLRAALTRINQNMTENM